MSDVEIEDGETTDELSWWSVAGLAAIFAFVFCAWIATPFVLEHVVPKFEERGPYGDQYGSVNALFTGLAFAGLIVTVLLQRKELALQRVELKETRKELKRGADAQSQAQEALNKTMYAQSFKVAYDILQSPSSIKARRHFTEREARLADAKSYWKHPEAWNVEDQFHAQVIVRNYQAMGTMIKTGMIPSSYILDTWSVPIHRAWGWLEHFVVAMRDERIDPNFGKDFEELAGRAAAFLAGKP